MQFITVYIHNADHIQRANPTREGHFAARQNFLPIIHENSVRVLMLVLVVMLLEVVQLQPDLTELETWYLGPHANLLFELE